MTSVRSSSTAKSSTTPATASASGSQTAPSGASVQRKPDMRGHAFAAQEALLAPVQRSAAGARGGGVSLPHLDRIQQGFEAGRESVQAKAAVQRDGTEGATRRGTEAGEQAPEAAPRAPAAQVPAPPTRLVDEKTNTMTLGPTIAWIGALEAALTGVTTAPAEGAFGAEMDQFEGVCELIKSSAEGLLSASSVTREGRTADPVLPPKEEVHAVRVKVQALRALKDRPALAAIAADLDAWTIFANEALVSCFQGLAVLQARKSWRAPKNRQASEADLGNKNRESTEVDEIFKAGRKGGGRQGYLSPKKKTRHKWCGYTVAANLSRGAGLDPSHLQSFASTPKGEDYFSYRNGYGQTREVIYSPEERCWMPVAEYHEKRGSKRLWMGPKEIAAAGGIEAVAGDIQPGDVVFADTNKDGKHNHYAMADAAATSEGALTTIEGNFGGIAAGADGGAKAGRKNKQGRGPKYQQAGGSAVTAEVNDLRGTDRGNGKVIPGHAGRKSKDVCAFGRMSVIDFVPHTYKKAGVRWDDEMRDEPGPEGEGAVEEGQEGEESSSADGATPEGEAQRA